MSHQQPWLVRTTRGQEFVVFTPLGYSFQQAIEFCGCMPSEIESIVPRTIQRVAA